MIAPVAPAPALASASVPALALPGDPQPQTPSQNATIGAPATQPERCWDVGDVVAGAYYHLA